VVSGRALVAGAVAVPVALLLAALVVAKLDRPPGQAELMRVYDTHGKELACLLEHAPPETQLYLEEAEGQALLERCDADFAVRFLSNQGSHVVHVFEPGGGFFGRPRAVLGFAHLTPEGRALRENLMHLYPLDGGWDAFIAH
jgi:hypothetical protein